MPRVLSLQPCKSERPLVLKHGKGGEPNVTDYGEPQADGRHENQQEEQRFLATTQSFM